MEMKAAVAVSFAKQSVVWIWLKVKTNECTSIGLLAQQCMGRASELVRG